MKATYSAFMIAFVLTSACTVLCVNQRYYSSKLRVFASNEELTSFLEDTRYLEPCVLGMGLRPMGLQTNTQAMAEYSGTNVQTQGVDEADTVKTDGEYLYVIAKDRVFIVKAYPAEEAKVFSVIALNGSLDEIFINEDRLVVFFDSQSQVGKGCVARIYDVGDRTAPQLTREVAVEGSYFSSRMVGDYAYLVVRRYAEVIQGEAVLPKIRLAGSFEVIPATEIYYSDDPDYGYVYTTLLSINVKDDAEEPNHLTMLTGYTAIMYVSTENIYLATTSDTMTVLHLIHFENGEISHTADGEVRGQVLNQFSMDEREGYLRIATTSPPSDPSATQGMILNLENNVYIMDMNLNIVGTLEHIAPGEKIYSVRFMGNMCYLVTFRKVDPFFAIDVSRPYGPEIIGELKVSGFSDYLHPYDENHVIGVGKETVAAEEGDFSWYQGLKISLYDVTDNSEPKELAKYEIGNRGTNSPVLTDHRAFLFDQERKLLALPVSVAIINQSQYPNGVPPYAYGKTVWQGVYVFTVSLDLQDQITLKGTVTHVENGNLHIAHQITRVLYINDVLYTISQSKIKMNSLEDLSEIKEVNLNE
jgi:inhibitor of cysteine peptidase